MMSRCTALKSDGSKCKAYALRDDPAQKCLFHTELEDIKQRQRDKVWTRERLVRELQQQLQRIKREATDSLQQARLAIQIISMIVEIQGGKVLDSELGSFGERLREWKKESQALSRP
jgi:hypothetical protein